MKKLYYGAAYYPELWDVQTIERDIELMKAAHINVARMGEFAWSTLEPHKNHFNIEFYAEIIERLYQNGIQTILCTPTATPPVWMSYGHPERMLVDQCGDAMVHGGRQQVCTNNSYMRARSRILIEKMAKVYGKMPGVIVWQLDNELKGNVSECYCASCKSHWHHWLESKYGDIETLNAAWGTQIWSQQYESFEQIPQPFKTPMGHNPSLVTAYGRFSRELASEFLKEQAKLVRKFSSLPITHNSSLNHFIDNEMTFGALDFASFDHYSVSQDYHKMLSWMDAFKTLKGRTPFWVMETAPTFSGSIYGYQPIHKAGYIVAEAAAAYALGAEGFCYWLWRQHRTGAEQTHGHVISAWGEPGVGFEAVVEAGRLKERLEKAFVDTSPSQAEIAVTYSDTARLFFMTEPLEIGGIDYTQEMMKWYQWMMECGIYRDIIFEGHPFEGYKIVMTPFMPYISQEYLERALAFVEQGGTWIVGPLSGIRTKEHTVHTDHALGLLEAVAGVKTRFHYPITGSGAIGCAFDSTAPLTFWSTVFECGEAKSIGNIKSGLTPGLSFITECKRGKGKIVLLGSMPDGEKGKEMLQQMLRSYSRESGVKGYECTSGTIVIPRRGQDFEQWVLINMNGEGGQVSVPCRETIDLKPFECQVIQFKNSIESIRDPMADSRRGQI